MIPRTLLRALGALVSLAALGVAPDARADDPDPWFGRDQALHFGAGAILAGGGYAFGTALAEPRWKALALGGALAITAGAAKEAIDATGAGDPSWRDFTWDVIGAVVGLGVAYAVDAGLHGGRAPALGTTRAALVF